MDYGPHPSPVSFVVLPASLSRNARNSIVSAPIFLLLSLLGMAYVRREKERQIDNTIEPFAPLEILSKRHGGGL